MKLIGIFRETAHSPNREFDDYEILRLTGEELKKSGEMITLLEPDQALAQMEEWQQDRPELFFVMCEREEILTRLQVLESKGCVLINSIAGIRNTYRYRMIPLLENTDSTIPRTLLLSTAESVDYANLPFSTFWAKRGDVHNTTAGDVTKISSAQELENARQSFLSRGVAQWALQDHIEGDLIKFYGVGNLEHPAWFNWFYHKGQNLRNIAFDKAALQKLIFSAAQRLNLSVFGGDVVVDLKGNLFLIDINAWPSFALFRNEAAPKIAEHILQSIRNRV